MKVWVVMEYDCGGDAVRGVFDTKEKAEAFIAAKLAEHAEATKNDGLKFELALDIEEHELL